MKTKCSYFEFNKNEYSDYDIELLIEEKCNNSLLFQNKISKINTNVMNNKYIVLVIYERKFKWYLLLPLLIIVLLYFLIKI